MLAVMLNFSRDPAGRPDDRVGNGQPVSLTPFTAFGFALYDRVASDAVRRGEKHVVVSPTSVGLALSQRPELATGIELAIANALWASPRVAINQSWARMLVRDYGAQVEVADLTSRSIVGRVNGWVRENTRGRILEILREPLSPDAAFLLANAVYFRGRW